MYLALACVKGDNEVRNETIKLLEDFNSQTILTQAKKGE